MSGDLLDLLDEMQAAPEDHPLVAEFLRFNRENPAVYDVLVAQARSYVRQTGQRQCGLALLWERARWILTVETKTDDGFKLNDHLQPFFARLIMAWEEDLAGLFEVRRSVADVDPSWIGRAR